MQAIARVNRVFRGKPGGLVVDYLGLGTSSNKHLQPIPKAGVEVILHLTPNLRLPYFSKSMKSRATYCTASICVSDARRNWRSL